MEGSFDGIGKSPATVLFSSSENADKLSLKLDLRVDEVVFGRDEYPQCEKDEGGKHELSGFNLKIEEKIVREAKLNIENKKRALLQYHEESATEEDKIEVVEELQLEIDTMIATPASSLPPLIETSKL